MNLSWRLPLVGQLTRNKLRTIKRKLPLPAFLGWNFLTLHYLYIIGMTILGSIVLYPGGGISYTDALFFAAGAATQSGLNPVDVDKLKTYQQVWLWFGSMVCNPIVIHGFLVFVRLSWFEKRFEHVVHEAKALRRTKTKARTMSKNVSDIGPSEMGVRGRKIQVVRDSTGQAQGHSLETPKETPESSPSGNSGRNTQPEEKQANGAEGPGTDNPSRLPGPRSNNEHHIDFLENQRREQGALRIPGPREYDRGGGPQSLDDSDGGELGRRETSQSEHANRSGAAKGSPSVGRHITIDDPGVTRPRRNSTFARHNSRQTTTDREENEEDNELGRTRSRFSSITAFLHSRPPEEQMPYLSWQPTIGRNSAFVDLTEAQRDELGGIEYRSLKVLAVILVAYFIGFHLFGIVCLIPWAMHTRWAKIITAAGQGRPWWGVFTAGSAFNDQGFALTPDSMISFNDAIFPLLLMSFLIIIGNTGFPCMLRFIIWLLWKLVPRESALREELHFLLDHPRRCFTLLFPSTATWWLLGIVVALNGIDLFFFIILDLHTPEVAGIPGGIRVVDGIFQAAATRTAGLSVVNIANIHPATQVSYMIMMYISVYPIAISLRRTNVYEEKSLGIYTPPDEEDYNSTSSSKEPSYVSSHLRRQLSFDLWFIFLGLFLIAIIEGSKLSKLADQQFNMFGILFEIISAYGTVGLSFGFPGLDTSLSGGLNVLSKLIVVAMEIRGRHRGLPYQVDRAILLPSESLHAKEAADATKRLRRRTSAMSTNRAPSTASGAAGDLHAHDPRAVDMAPNARFTSGHNVTPMPTHREHE